jgi:hypothetical protein
LPGAFRAFAIDLPEDAPLETAVPSVSPHEPETSRRCGDSWAASLRSGALIVPSRLSPAQLEPGGIGTSEHDALLNPRDVPTAAWRVTETSFRFDAPNARADRTGNKLAP